MQFLSSKHLLSGGWAGSRDIQEFGQQTVVFMVRIGEKCQETLAGSKKAGRIVFLFSAAFDRAMNLFASICSEVGNTFIPLEHAA